MNNTSRVLPEENIFNDSTDGTENKVILRLEQKSVEWMMDSLSKFYTAKELVLDTWGYTSASAKACLRLPEYCRFLGYK